MSVPNVQIKQNDDKVEVFWEVDYTNTYVRFKLYWSLASNMAGEAAFSGTLLNSPSARFSSKHIMYGFNRSQVGVGVNTGFYLRVKGVKSNGDEVNGATRYIPAIDEIAGAENVSKMYGYDPTLGVWRKITVDSTGKIDTV
jgi:hypothetical protein